MVPSLWIQLLVMPFPSQPAMDPCQILPLVLLLLLLSPPLTPNLPLVVCFQMSTRTLLMREEGLTRQG